MNALVTITGRALPALPVADIERAADFAKQDKSPKTRAPLSPLLAGSRRW